MPPTKTFPLTDRALGGNLEKILRDWRTAGESLETMTYRLRSEHQVVVSRSTVHRWCEELGIEAPPVEPSPAPVSSGSNK